MGWPKGIPRGPMKEGTKQKLSKAKMGFKHSEETKKRLSKYWLGKRRGPDNPRWNGGKPSCVECGKEINHGYIYCKSCARKGERCYAWKGGCSFEPYPPEFNAGLKRKIRGRDNHTCQKCGRIEAEELEEFGQVLSIHHIDEIKKNCEETNLITLCGQCNSEVSRDSECWQSFFEQLIRSKECQA